jgi:hypothetical protein
MASTTASSANRPDLISSKVQYVAYPVYTATHIYQYTHVGLNSGGYLVPMSDDAALTYVGQAMQEVNNTGASAALYCNVVPFIAEPFQVFDAISPAIATWLGLLVYWTSDYQVALTASSTYKNVAGQVVEILSTATAGKVRVNTAIRA